MGADEKRLTLNGRLEKRTSADISGHQRTSPRTGFDPEWNSSTGQEMSQNQFGVAKRSMWHPLNFSCSPASATSLLDASDNR
jgi:hypothetical protein